MWSTVTEARVIVKAHPFTCLEQQTLAGTLSLGYLAGVGQGR